ncbi:hypothetical protein RhiirA5_504422 [Rhizophagus irregularis]|uniref:MIR domain-containing protein n=2 Tax=Rhizophagus irregularis TaxID=588596 RepID=A0A2N0P4V2_9GLOM|nr:hypothetical protein RhiirA5_504422 [Rhizophagus irregularis]
MKPHPEVWLNKIKLYCYKNQITKKEDIIEFCKSMIHPSINVSKANTFEEISNTLKNDIFFISFKHSVKTKLQKLKFDPKDKNYVQFINIFREYCYEAEINVEEQLLEKLPEDSFQYYFINNNLEKINSLNDLIIYFNQSFLEQTKIDSLWFICDLQYKTGSKRSIVFASQALSKSNSLWIVSCDQNNNGNPIIYGKSEVYLKKNKGILEYLVISNNYNPLQLEIGKHLIEIMNSLLLLKNETYQEIVGHKGRVDENDKWCIELFENK